MEVKTSTVASADVRATLGRHLLADGLPLVLDLDVSKGLRLVDAASGKTYLDLFGFYASSAVGLNHPKMTGDADFLQRLTQAALNKVTNSDVYTPHMARFLATFSRVGIPEALPHAFFVEGGALAVENALKAAFDWKVRKNFVKGYTREVGTRVLHFTHAFHGRSGYTMSLTNTDPRKVAYFPKFDWPRIESPAMVFPCTGENLDETVRREERALAQARMAFQEHGDDIACILIEPVQSEGGDHHFRPEFLQALKDLCAEHDCLLIFDEVQTGVGMGGAFWCFEALGVTPDLIAFGKKTQVCGILAGRRLDEVHDNVFQLSSRINSTWGGNLVDMVRFDKILEIIEEDGLVDNANARGAELVAGLEALARRHEAVTQVRGRGLLVAFDLPTPGYRNRVLELCWEYGAVLLGCGHTAIRFRPPLTITADEVQEGLAILGRALAQAESEEIDATRKGRK